MLHRRMHVNVHVHRVSLDVGVRRGHSYSGDAKMMIQADATDEILDTDDVIE
jgi:hypothetical protein